MLQNLKADIIYYKTNTDFEMEFNLCGCCRMRLLTDKSPDSKNFVHNLARAVSRSRIIIVAGSLFGEDGIISMVATAISKKLVAVDNTSYGISCDDEIKIINGAIPLVTPDGIFGGCIIESGPQTMILLTESKEVRKTIMNTLIHPYIKDICNLETPAEPVSDITPAEEQEEIAEETEELLEVAEETEEIDEFAEEITEEPVEEAVETQEETEEMPEEEPEEAEDIILSKGMIFEEKAEAEVVLDEFYEDTDDADQFIFNTETLNDFKDLEESVEEEEEEMMPPRFLNIPILILIIILFVVLAALVFFTIYAPLQQGVTPAVYLEDIYNTLFT